MHKTKNVVVRMSELDYQTIKEKAETLQMSVSEYIRNSAVNRQIKGVKANDNSNK